MGKTREMTLDNGSKIRVVFIQYRDKLPFSVITANETGHLGYFDFEFFHGDKTDLRYENSGSGGHMRNIPVEYAGNSIYWLHLEAAFDRKPVSGTRIDKPFRIKGRFSSSINPFKVAEEVYSMEYCSVCDRWSDHECEEDQYWDDENGVIRYIHDNSEAE